MLRDYSVALAGVLAVVLLLRLASPLANATTVALCLVLVVVFVARGFRGSAAFLAAIVSVVALNYFFIPPFGTLTVADPTNWVALLDAVTHNLRTPITSIKASATTLLSESAINELVKRELLTVANEEADRLDLLVEDLIGLARIEAGDLGLQVNWCNLEDVVSSAIRRAQALLRRRRVELSLPLDLPVVRADARSLEEVLFQLLENAAKDSPRDSLIGISAEVQPGGFIDLRVDDHGPGVPALERDRIFNKFYRPKATEASASGAGLGLAIARGITNAHRGHVLIVDRPDGHPGARFVVRIPIGDEDEA